MKITATENILLWQLLLKEFPESNRTRIKKMITLGCVSIGGGTVKRPDVPIQKGQMVEFKKYEPRKQHKEKAPFSIVYEDDFLIAVVKPAGILSSGRTTEKTRSMLGMVRHYLKARQRRDVEIFVVHRLDREVSGLLLFAKTAEVQTWFKENWNKVQKFYYALVHGVPVPPQGTIDTFLNEDNKQKMYIANKDEDGAQRAITHYKVVEKSGGAGETEEKSLLRVQLETGRKNQIRVHLAYIGHPIIGDIKYGQWAKAPREQVALFAYSLEFPHPITNRKVKIEITPPAWNTL
ncbi:MAG: RluA family pseudouridine synthase [Bacteroidales bacterium]|jgi:23S rRNA pseudouridine1911/1915/1917 synthase|nr:RluA family pseudouridine synthase [Bacteroidales bacterium]